MNSPALAFVIMRSVTTEQMRGLERRAIEELGIAGAVLMDRAGRGVAEVIRQLLHWRNEPDTSVRLIAGRGNNGGDAFAAAFHLHGWNVPVDVWLAGTPDELKGDALLHYRHMTSSGVAARVMATEADWPSPGAGSRERVVLVDGLLGTGLQGAARGVAARAIDFLNAMGARSPIVAIDVPSGLNSDTGVAEGAIVRADITVTMGLPKQGMLQPAALPYVGQVEVVDIGLPAPPEEWRSDAPELIAAEDVRRLFARRAYDSHKGTYGHLLIIGGAHGYTGAAGLAALGARRCGVGLVSVLTPASVSAAVSAAVPEAMVHPAEETAAGSLSAHCLRAWGRNMDEFDAVLIGPGMTQNLQTSLLIEQILAKPPRTLIMDADALNVMAGKLGRIRDCPASVIVTPHPGEMGRLLGRSAADVQSDRAGAAREAAAQSGATVVLKGAGTLVVDADSVRLNTTGNAGMAQGGMGDVLSGMIAGLASQGREPLDAASAGVFMHGRAGDIAAWRGSQASMTAGDVCHALPLVWRELTGR